MVEPVPSLRIIGDHLWEAAQARRPAWPLAGLVKCGVCDGLLTVMGKDRLGCANHQARNICSNNRTILRHRLQAKSSPG
jgi:site-specific DNA recombinase